MKVFKKTLLIIIVIVLLAVSFFFAGKPPQVKEIKWGVNFSQKHSQNLGLDWKDNYSSLIDDLRAKNIKLATYWDLLEPEEGNYVFSDLDWQIQKAEENEASVFLVIGMKTPRWPECHIPGWAKTLSKEEQQKKILGLLETIVLRYRDFGSITMWQVENEPFFPFGECPWVDKEFLKEEIALIKSLDYQERPIVVSDSGEGSFWFAAASLGDMAGTTMYRKVWVWQLKTYFTYPLPGVFYWRKAQLIKAIFGKEVICVELQAEPWGPELLYSSPLDEQAKTMNLEQFKKNIEFAKQTGLKEFYLWGAEWWYWMKEKQGDPAIWQQARTLFD